MSGTAASILDVVQRFLEPPPRTFELSFPSGHTALTATVFLRHPKSQLRYFFLGGGMVLTHVAIGTLLGELA